MTSMGEQFSARNVARWTVDGTELTVETDADMRVGEWRQNMERDLAAQKRGERTLACVHWTDSFLGKTGSSVHGRGWKLHIPQDYKQFDLWEAVDHASVADWTEWAGEPIAVTTMSGLPAAPSRPNNDMTPGQKAALERLIEIAKNDTGQSRRVADFLLSWWNAANCGKFDLTEIWGVDDAIAGDMVTVFGLVANCNKYPDKLGYEKDFVAIVKAWRPELE